MSDVSKFGVFSLPEGKALDISNSILSAILEHRLPPGTKLSEQEVGTLFNASRAVVRNALHALAHTGLIIIEKNRGAFVATPDKTEAHEIFEARALIEPKVAALAARKATKSDIRHLRKHLEAEEAAMAAGDIKTALALSGTFHVEIAEVADHSIYSQIVQSLVTKSSLTIAVYWKRPDTTCENHSHDALIKAFETHDEGSAADIMKSHIIDLHSGLDLSDQPKTSVSLREILKG